MLSKPTNIREAGVNHSTLIGAQIPELVSRIAAVANDQNFHSKTVHQIKQEYGITMSSGEAHRWRKYRNQVNILKKKDKLQLQKAERDAKKEKISFLLLTLSNKQLCKKIIHLERAHRNQGLRGKNIRPQLVRALALHTTEEIEQIVVQIQSFTDKQKASAHYAIDTIIGIRNALKINQRNTVLISHFTDDDLRNEFSELYNSKATKDWPPMFEKTLMGKLAALGEKKSVKEFRHRVKRLRTSKEFTKEIKDSVLECINLYIASKN